MEWRAKGSESSEALLQTLLDISPAVIGLNGLGEVDLWNSAAVELFGWTAAEVMGKALPKEFGLQEDWFFSVKPFAAKVRRKDGQAVEVELRGAPRQEEGRLILATDLTRENKTELDANIRVKAESRFRELLEAAPDAIIEVDREGHIVLLNAVTEGLFGYKRAELLGQPVERLIPESAGGRHTAHRAAYWANPGTRPMGFGLTLLARRKDGSEFPVEISLSPVKTDDGFRVTAIIRDVTAKKLAEAEIRAANQQLELRNRELDRVNKLKSEFLASMSHELRTPLHTIIGFTELLAEEMEGPLNEKQKRFLGHVHRDSRHLLELINDVLDLSKIESGRLTLNLEVFDAASVISEAVNGIRPMADSRGVEVEDRIEGAAVIQADRVRFREVLNNLLSNAVKFTPEGGRVAVERGPSTDGKLSFTVSDTGVGIAPEDHEAVFDKFRQVGSTPRGVREGTGLGLAIVKSLVEMHGGTITLQSVPGQGSQFTFSIPAGDLGSPMVLVIEDEAGGRELLSSYLQPLGIRTECAAGAEEGIRMARDLKPDAITLDLLMPGKNGWRALRELRSSPDTSGIPVLVVSVLDERQAALELGATDYLQKPLRKEALLKALRRHAPSRFSMI